MLYLLETPINFYCELDAGNALYLNEQVFVTVQRSRKISVNFLKLQP